MWLTVIDQEATFQLLGWLFYSLIFYRLGKMVEKTKGFASGALFQTGYAPIMDKVHNLLKISGLGLDKQRFCYSVDFFVFLPLV